MNSNSVNFITNIIKSILTKTQLLLAVIIFACISTGYIYLSTVSKQVIQNNSENGAQRYLEALSEFRTLYTSEVVSIAKKQGITITHNYQNDDNAIPLPATLSMALGEKIGQHQSGAKTFLYSKYPFPWREDENKALFEQPFVNRAWDALNQNPDKPYFEFIEYNGKESIRYAVSDKMREGCISCHNDHPQTPKSDWKINDVRGVLEVILPVDIAQAATQKSINSIFILLSAVALVFMLLLWITFKRINKDKKALTQTNNDLSDQKKSLELTHQKLEIHAAELSTAIQSKSDFLACMSHEIRTPMNGVLGMLRMLTETKLNDDQQHKIGIAQSSAESLLSIINDILDFSKIEQGKLELENIEFNLIKSFSDVCEAMTFRADAKNIEIILDISGINNSLVIGDSNRLRQILTNLIGNSIKFTDKGEVRVWLALEHLNETEVMLQCKIYDTGIGIPNDKINSLFDAFTQVDASTTRVYGGSGLGLSICKRLTQLMGGNIGVSSVIGQGSCFEFDIKLNKSKQQLQIKPDFLMQGLTVLVIDTNQSLLNYVEKQLKTWGVNIIVKQNLKQADKMLNNVNTTIKKQDIDFMILGFSKDNQNTFFDDYTQYKSLHEIKSVILTAMSQKLSDKLIISPLCFAHINKPITPYSLVYCFTAFVEFKKEIEKSSLSKDTNYFDKKNRKFKSYNQKNQEIQTIQKPQMKWMKDCKVLLVEDNQVNQLVALSMLEEYEFIIEIANNGEEAISILNKTDKHQPFNLIFMDCQMPILDGYQATKQIREAKAGSQYKDITIIAMTANAMKGDKEKCIDAGMNQYLTKPLNQDELNKILAEIPTPK
ncbi:MAG: response regulator [Saccharospirillaceae bacterium]|nr:ATP-binding protein [Pseudomonadales bacterium]NRB81127.1 response regulator [Saccharospirillaceae bacterium]